MEFLSPVGRLVQGGMTLRPKIDLNTNKPAVDEQGKPIMEQFLALAIAKNDPNLPAFYAIFNQEAQAAFPHLFVNGQCTHPRFAWKIQDGDGIDHNGKSVATKPGFAGHWIFKMQSRYAPKCFHAGKYDPAQQIQNPDDVIKCGYYIRVAGTTSGNGVKPNDPKAVPGLYMSANLVELVAFGEVIQSGPDAAKAFGAVPLPASLPPGAASAPVSAPGPVLAAPPLPGAPVAVPLPLPAPVPTGPSYQMTASAMGGTREGLLALGWTDDALLAAGHMIRV